jgi:hypothetical protein
MTGGIYWWSVFHLPCWRCGTSGNQQQMWHGGLAQGGDEVWHRDDIDDGPREDYANICSEDGSMILSRATTLHHVHEVHAEG